MHRQKTRIAARVTRAARTFEYRGIIATYRLHDRLLRNQVARRRFQRSSPGLDEVQQRVLEALRTEGYALLPFSELLPDPSLWEALEHEGERFTTETAEGLRKEAAGEASGLRRTGKDFVLRRDAYGSTIRPDDPWLRIIADRQLLDVANAYLQLWSKIEYVDLWYTPPQPADAERRASQRWHRDFDDRYLLKVFVYLTDVDQETGPFEYVPRSQPGGAYDELWPWHPMSESYPPQEELTAKIGDSVKTFTGPKGTMILCNTSGFHRGGFVTGKPRVLATATYCSPASLAALTERNFQLASGGNGSVDPVVRYALG
jgi:ectoine hydroxylase-related dioxygenase (phytanoyl-CoA dioxygenase family)